MKPLFSVLLFILIASCADKNGSDLSWKVYRGDDGVNAWSNLDQIDTSNVGRLKVAWTYRTGDNSGNSSIECNPLIIAGILYGVSPKLKTFALDAKTGKQKWIFNPFDKNSQEGGVLRGLTYWRDGDDERIFLCASYKLIALDAKTGRQIMDFGDSGFVDMRKGLRNDNEIEKYYITNTSPGVIYKDLIIIGCSLGESYQSLPGNIRAYNVRTGRMQWIFHTVPQPGEFGYDTWPKDAYKFAGGCNAWSGLSIDKKRGMVFAATGAPGFDFHGGDRIGDNLFANSVIAINADNGKYIWHYQVSHHDIWDYDLPSPPNLVTIKKDGKAIDAVAQITKQGWILLFDREKGTPLIEMQERKVPASLMADERASPTQPFPVGRPALSRQHFDTSMITNISPESTDSIRREAAKRDFGEIYTPPSTKGIIQMPGFRGGGEWSGGAVDPNKGVMYIGANDMPNMVQLVELPDESLSSLIKMPVLKAGEKIFMDNCSPCHGADRKGNGPYPSLLNIQDRLNPLQAQEVVEKGRNKMPSFIQLPEYSREAVVAYLFNLKNKKIAVREKDTASNEVPMARKYKIKGYIQLKDPFGYPGVTPPWSSLNAVNLSTGKILWKRPLGEYPELSAKGIPVTGTQLFGGAIATAGGLLFIGASKDEKFRAIDAKTGKTLWEYQLPAGGYATPATYTVDGKQYVVIAAGGGGFQVTKTGDYYVAFALEGE